MKNRYLEITFRSGRPIAAYLYLGRREGDSSARTEDLGGGLLVDFASDGRPIGVEIFSPGIASVESLNQALARINERPLTSDEARPLAA